MQTLQIKKGKKMQPKLEKMDPPSQSATPLISFFLQTDMIYLFHTIMQTLQIPNFGKTKLQPKLETYRGETKGLAHASS